nr:MAG TPA: hypothetical protein [Caudoviricetes sp.]
MTSVKFFGRPPLLALVGERTPAVILWQNQIFKNFT